MATEKRLIDINELIEYISKRAAVTYPNFFPGMYKAIEYMRKFETINAVEMVQCSDCVSSEPCEVSRGRVWCRKICRYMKKDGYCSESERRNNV